MSIRLQSLGHVLLVVRDLDTALDFYTQVLGLEVVERDLDHGGVFLAVEDGSHVLDLMEMPPAMLDDAQAIASTPKLGVQHFAFRMASEDALRSAYFVLQDRGQNVLNAIDHVNQQSVYVNDPDGNIVELYWERPNQREIWEQGRGDLDRPLTFERS